MPCCCVLRKSFKASLDYAFNLPKFNYTFGTKGRAKVVKLLSDFTVHSFRWALAPEGVEMKAGTPCSLYGEPLIAQQAILVSGVFEL